MHTICRYSSRKNLARGGCLHQIPLAVTQFPNKQFVINNSISNHLLNFRKTNELSLKYLKLETDRRSDKPRMLITMDPIQYTKGPKSAKNDEPFLIYIQRQTDTLTDRRTQVITEDLIEY